MRPWRVVEPLPDGRYRVTYRDPREQPNELLWPDRFPESVVAALELDLGNFASAQLAQNPVSAEGGIFKLEWLKYWSPDGKIPGTIALPRQRANLLSWDCSFKGDATSDPSCGVAMGRAAGKFFITDTEWGRYDFPELCNAVRRLCDRNARVIQKLVEGKANGSAVVATLQDEYPGFEEVNPEGGKESRANAVAPLFKGGFVHLPHPSLFPWVTPAINELTRFPRGINDDFVDAVSQGLLKLYLGGPKLGELMAMLKANPGLRKAFVGR